jgi:phosphomannomutase
MSFPNHIFKAYDVRGVVGKELTEELFYRIGRASVVFTGAKHVFVGCDMRNSSESFKNSLISGLVEQGANVTDIGLISTPMLNIMTIRDEMADLGIMITASHNPPEYNGCKFVYKRTMMPIGLDSGLDQIRDMVEKYDFADVTQKGQIFYKDLKSEHVNFVMSLLDLSQIKPLKVVIDFGNGIEGEIIDGFIEKLPISVDCLYKEPDGNFPNHEANPLKHETLKELQKRVVETGADMGFAFDADADRVGLVDETGKIVPGDQILAMLVPEMLKKYPKEPILFDVKCSRSVLEVISKNGGKPIESRVGRTLVIQGMRKENAAFGGELSGHFYYKDLFGFESGDLTLLYILKLVSESGKKISELVSEFNKYFHSGEINFEVEDQDAVIAKFEEIYAKDAKRVSKMDGIKIEYEDWWFLIRKSNTEPLLRFVLEADSSEKVDEKVDEIKKIIGI